MFAVSKSQGSPPTLEADCVYVQMKKQYRVSRYIRAQWFVNQIGKVIQLKHPCENDIAEEVEVLSALPRDKPTGWRPNRAHEFAYLVTPATKVTFLAKKYRFVFCLDLSVSIANVDIRSETFLFDEVFATLSKCVEKLVKPFNVPGSCVVFQPEIYVTVIAYIPHYTPSVQQVLIQGWPLTPDNCALFLSKVSTGLSEICIVLAEATAGVAELHDQLRLQSEKLTGGLFEESDEQACTTPLVNMVSSDMSTLSMLRYGMLALQLLPENSSAGIVVITDGVISVPNSQQLELLLGSLRGGTVACSFLHLGGGYHAQSSLGYVPYDDLMRFIARATFGAYLNSGSLVGPDEIEGSTGTENIFHRALLFWSFQEEFINQRLELAKDAGMQYKLLACKGNTAFEPNQGCMPQLRKKSSDGSLNTSLSSVLSCKLREGYALRSISTAKGELEIKLVLPWKFDVNIEYVVMVPWQSSSKNRDSSGSGSQPKQRAGCKFEVCVEASYDFLHDVTCEYFKPNKTRSPFRLMVAQQYWNALKNISSTDQLLVHLHSFNQNPVNYSVPESFRNGVPVFVMPPNSSGHPVLSSNVKNNSAYAPFVHFWKPVCMLDISIWQRWMHMHRVGMLLEHDLPLPKHLQQPNSSGRYDSVQCRQALHRLLALLRDRSSFVLADGHSYVTFLGESDKPPVSFYVTRVTYKAPCVVIRFAFLGGTPGEQRNVIVKDLTQQILSLELSKRVAKDAHSDGGLCIRPPVPRTYRKASCCILFRKPLERILIRHEKIPKDILSPVVALMDVTLAHPLLHTTPHLHRHSSSSGSGSAARKGNGITTVVDPTGQLSRYLHHRRWIWTVQRLPSVPLPLHAITRILKTLAKMRLEEGFHFAHSSSGILNMALEIEMKNTVTGDSSEASLLPCVVQYMLFPPHSNTTIRESLSDDEDNEMETAEADGELQLVSECWVEPQCGVVVNCPVSSSYLDGKQYTEIPKALFEMDFECLSSLITLEHLNLSCLKPELACPGSAHAQRAPPPTPPVTPTLAGVQPSFVSRSTPDITLSQNMPLLPPVAPEPAVSVVPFPFSIMKLLSKCQQTEILFSTFIQELRPLGGDGGKNHPVDCEGRPRPQPNDLLYEQLLDNLHAIHDREVPLGLEEQALLPNEIHNRPRDQHAYPVPFAVPPVQATPVAWRCFVASFSSANSTAGSSPTTPISHVVLTFIPATFENLQRLMMCPDDEVASLGAEVHHSHGGRCTSGVPKDYAVLQTESSSEPVATSSADREALTSSAAEDPAAGEVCDLYNAAESQNFRQLTTSHSDPALSSHGAEKHELLPRQRSADLPDLGSQSQCRTSTPCPPVARDDDGSTSPKSQEAKGAARRLVSVSLPVYVYDAPVSAVIGRLVYQGGVRQWKDTYLDLTTRSEENMRAGSEPSWVECKADGSEGSPYKTMSPEPKSDDSELGSDRFPARKHCSRLRKAFSKSFVYGVFRALCEGLPVDMQDVSTVVEDACEETALTLDITEFIQAICGHTRDFRIKSTVEHSHRTSTGAFRQDGTSSNEASCEGALVMPVEEADATASADESCRPSGDGVSSLFPVNLLKRHHPCDVVQQLHLSIKQRFQELLEEVFQRIPSHPDYYYFCPPCHARTMWGLTEGASGGVPRNADANAEEEGALCDWDDTDTDRSHNVEFSMDAEPAPDTGQSGDEKGAAAALSKVGNAAATEITSIESCAGSARSPPSPGEDDSGDEDEEDEEEVMETIREAEPMVPPLFAHLTCLVTTKSGCGSCSLTSLPTCLGEVISCLDESQPEVDLESIKIRLDFLCLTLPPDVEKLSPGDARLSSSSIMFDSERQRQDDDAESIASIGYQLEAARDPLHHLPEFQNEVISRCIEKLKWMLKDEMASAALNSFPLTAEALHMVAEHVRSTAEARTTTRLHATTGAPGCQVQKVPLQFVFGPEQSFGKFLQEFKHLTLPGYQLEQVDKDHYCVVLDDKDSKVVRRPFGSLVPPLGLSDEDESGDGGAPHTSFRAWRRQTGKSARTKSAERRLERASSLPLDSLVIQEDPKPEGRTPGASCPLELLDLRRKLQEEAETLEADSGTADHAANLSSETIVQEQKAAESQETAEAPAELVDESGSSEQQDGGFRDRTDSLASSLGHGMAFRPPQHLLESTRSTPNPLSEVGGQISNTEDGYDGDSSESDSDRDWMNALETQRSHLPPFWLILCPFLDHVDIFFHVREQPGESTELRQGLVVFESIVGLIQDTCKIVNQILLLQHLNNTRMCNRLLVPEASEDIWNRESEIEPNNSTASVYDNDGSGEGHGDYLEATLKFKPGAFDCSIVWSTHFSLHPRLNTGTGTGRSGISRGLQALRAVLTQFSVNNRKNMFVYQEISGSVFYLRLHEVPCHGRHGRAEDDVSFSGSRSSSLVSLVQKKAACDQDEEFDFRPRLSSGHSDRDQSHDTVSVTSLASGSRSKPQQCVVMNVHGIVQPGFAIKEELVSAMQNRLDDAVLEVLTTTLARNPACNLTIDDVQFIQKPQKEPTTQLYCTVQAQLLPYLQALMEYLRQDLHTFLPTPKYTDPKPENHFKPYVEHPAHALCHKDEDVFLFNRFMTRGTPSNGIACIILSVVDAQGRPVQFLNSPLLKAGAFSGTEPPTEYQEVSFLSREEVSDASADGTPGPMAMIRFQVWCVGKDYQEHLVQRLQSTVQHAYWDVLMEYRLLTCPVFHEAYEEGEPACFSEPPTPVKVRRTGRVLAEQARDKPFLFGMFASRGKEMSSSVPDVSEKVKSPKENPTEFNFSDSLFADVAPSLPPGSAKGPMRSMEAEFLASDNWASSSSKKLNAMFQHGVHGFLEGGVQIRVPSLVVHRCTVKARRAVPLILKEFQNGLKNLAPEISLTMFTEEGTRRPSRPTEFIHINPLVKHAMFPEKYAETAVPGSQRCFIVVGRDMAQWKAFMGISSLSTYLENNRTTKGHKSTQLFEPHMLPVTASLDTPALCRTPSTPSSVPPTIVAPPEKAKNAVTAGADAGETRQPALIPRQRLLFLRVEDKSLTLYLYNWTSDQGQELFKLLGHLVEWQDLRNDFLRSIAVQKMGLFFHQPSASTASPCLRQQPQQQQQQATTGHQLHSMAVATQTPTSGTPSHLWAFLDHMISRHNPPSRHQETTAAATRLAVHNLVGQVLRGVKPRTPMQAAPYATCDDPVIRHGRQVQEMRGLRRRELVEFHRIYDDKGTSANLLVMEKMLTQVKKEARLVHYCLTPLLFSPTWRLKVAQVRDHTLEAAIASGLPSDCPVAHDQPPAGQRTRHSSGGSQKSIGGDASNAAASRRMRRASGVPSVTSGGSGGGGGGQPSSPKQHRRSTNEETWHMTVCSHYIQEYIQYLQNLGFMAIQTKHTASRKSSTMSVRRRESDASNKRQNVGALSLGELPRHCLFQWHLGGLYFFEVGFCDPYVSCNLFLVERQRLLPSGTQLYMSQVTSEFTEDLDKIRVNMHMHSFTYDYHLRTIHSYISGQQLLFKHGYHLTSFLDDFVKYYQKSPNYARNLIYAGSVVIPSVNVAPNQLYNYIIGHNKLYGMKVIRMVPVVCDSSSDLDTEYALVEISNKKVSYRDANDVQQTDSFFVGILTIHDTAPAFIEHNLLALGFYILLTSQRELFPKFSSTTGPPGSSASGNGDGTGDGSEGCFRPVRTLGGTPGASQPTSAVPSRRSSFVVSSAPVERMRTLTTLPQQLVLSPEDMAGSGSNAAVAPTGIPSVASSSSLGSSNAGGTRSRKTSFRGICEEEVAYLGYYSCHETLMQKVMSEQATAVADHLREVVARASLHCRRDYLWKCLMWRHKNSDDASSTVRENTARPSISFAELTELLGYVKTVPLDQLDPQLGPLLSSHFGWYRGLLRVLVQRYVDCHCLFVSPDNTLQYLVVMSPSCADSFILLTINTQLSRADLRLVHRENSQQEKSSADKSSSGLSTLHALVEELVTTCCFHEWAGLLT
ncbi:KICSTOR complex protein SZT2 isoform X2 [Dermacentor silvarum]|uniref:KICSTOR complex protein SZT2 isoform X2 n=1 Tax=Dermacentor silvarum TaxID=543639 RepID=UPI002100AADD|nr:KICSTOR complex protein SZT2 isoform X2 [Dermacentor silvarum]